jgi:hypothetical protein
MKRKLSHVSQEIPPESLWWRPGGGAAKTASTYSATELERVFLAELRTRRARLKQWLRLVELEFIRQTEAGVAKPRRRLKQRTASQVS